MLSLLHILSTHSSNMIAYIHILLSLPFILICLTFVNLPFPDFSILGCFEFAFGLNSFYFMTKFEVLEILKMDLLCHFLNSYWQSDNQSGCLCIWSGLDGTDHW